MKNKIFTLSEDANLNYIATICRIESLSPIENSDKLLKTIISGFDVVVGNNMKIGDIVIYFPIETSICKSFLAKNNLFEIGEYERNANAAISKEFINKANEARTNGDMVLYDENIAKAKEICGFFNKHGRVKVLTLRKQPSQGFITPISSFENYKPQYKGKINWESLVGTTFNMVDDELFCKKYIIPLKESNSGKGKRNRKNKDFDRIIPDQFAFHYDTNQLPPNIHQFAPDTNIVISNKLHGTSALFGNILCNKKLTIWQKVKRLFGANYPKKEYANVYSSRSVIKNRYINPNGGSYYNSDVWGFVNDIIKPYLTEGMTVYGEIIGYIPNNTTMIQKDFDYGCEVGTCKFMPYRITETDEFGEKTEWDLKRVQEWTKELKNRLKPETEGYKLFNLLLPITIVYQGRFGDLYSDIIEDEYWQENVLARLKTDKNFYMEMNDPMCKNKVPFEGLVFRIMDDKLIRAYKLKTQKFYEREKKDLDNEVIDIESQES